MVFAGDMGPYGCKDHLNLINFRTSKRLIYLVCFDTYTTSGILGNPHTPKNPGRSNFNVVQEFYLNLERHETQFSFLFILLSPRYHERVALLLSP